MVGNTLTTGCLGIVAYRSERSKVESSYGTFRRSVGMDRVGMEVSILVAVAKEDYVILVNFYAEGMTGWGNKC